MIVTKKGSGTTSRRERMRCKDCRKKTKGNGRFTLPRPLKEYVGEVRCPRCRSVNVASNEEYRCKEEQKRVESGQICRCEHIPFRHRKGTLRMCAYHPDYIFGIEPTDEEKAQHMQMLLVPRTRDEFGYTEKAANDEELPI